MNVLTLPKNYIHLHLKESGSIYVNINQIDFVYEDAFNCTTISMIGRVDTWKTLKVTESLNELFRLIDEAQK